VLPVIISASRRTDIPAFYAEWFMRRVRAGFCTVPNPLNPKQISRVSLRPEDVEVIVFWTRHPRALMPFLDELDERGYRYYFLYTVLNNPKAVDPGVPALETAVATFRKLAQRLGPERVVWRYDPVVLSNVTDVSFHESAHQSIAEALKGATNRCVVSLVDPYRKIRTRMDALAEQGLHWREWEPDVFAPLARHMAKTAAENGMAIVSCAENMDLQPHGVQPGKCIDDGLIQRVFGVRVTERKDPAQRDACGCVTSKDIGMYDTCVFGCRYCYAVSSFERAEANRDRHNSASESLLETVDAG